MCASACAHLVLALVKPFVLRPTVRRFIPMCSVRLELQVCQVVEELARG